MKGSGPQLSRSRFGTLCMSDLLDSSSDTSIASGSSSADPERTGPTPRGIAQTPRRRADDFGSDPNRAHLLMARSDRLATFAPAILAIRWSTTMVSIALAASAFMEPDWTIIPWVAAIVCNTAIRTLSPLTYTASVRSLLNLIVEVAFHLVAVAATGFWFSPLTFSLVTSITIASFARGFGFGLRIGGATAIAVSLPQLLETQWSTDQLGLSAQWSTVLMLVAIIAGYARRISWEASQQQVIAMDRLSRLADANGLLFDLHKVAQLLPASLDSDEVLDSTMTRLKGLVTFDSAAILLFEDADATWVVARKRNMRFPTTLSAHDFPLAPRRAVHSIDPITVGAFDGSDTTQAERGFDPKSRSGIYVPLLARDSLIGLLAIESHTEHAFDERAEEVLGAFVEPAALAIDNARLFSRLRTVGADEERTRIARDLHDRIGQSLAYLAFELDRILNRDDAGGALGGELSNLRNDLRTVVSEVRDTLYDLRTDVGADKDFASTLEEFSARVADRSDLEITLDCERTDRLPILQEREMWRIAQEALINVERHADAEKVKVTWLCNGSTAVLEVADDGRGFPDGHAGRADSYGILGMRERAASIGAALEVISHPGEGTTIRCSLAHG